MLRTESGKATELGVRNVVHSVYAKATEALAHPEALALYWGLAELKT